MTDIIRVRYEDGTTDAFQTEGGETGAMREELEADPGVESFTIEYKVPVSSQAEPETEPEIFLIRTEGGPFPGPRIIDSAEFPLTTWPLPDVLPMPPGFSGRYVKITESALPPMPRDGHVMRGAQYEWKEDGDEPSQP